MWQQIDDHSIDLIICDPPYGALTDVQPWDVRPDFHVLAWIFSILLKPNGQVVMFGDFMTCHEIQEAFSRYFTFNFKWEWCKPSVIPRNHHRPANDLESVLVYKLKSSRGSDIMFNVDALRTPGDPFKRNGGKNQNQNPTLKGGGNLPDSFENTSGQRYPRSILHFPNKPCMKKVERTKHPTQKSLDMIRTLIRGLSEPSDLILDPMAGSGTTVIASYLENRESIGFELNEEYYQMAKDRINQYTNQTVLELCS